MAVRARELMIDMSKSLFFKPILPLLCALLTHSILAAEDAPATGNTRVGARVAIDGAPLFDDTIYDGATVDGAVPAEADATLVDERTALEISQQLTRFEENIAQLEGEFGPYDDSLLEALLDQARYLTQIGQHQEAAEAYDRALSITRISGGLLSEQQLPVLEDLTAAHKAAGDWQKADDKEHLTWYLYSRLHTPGSPEHTRALIDYGNWKVDVARRNLLGRSMRANAEEMASLQEVYASALDQIASAQVANEDTTVSAQQHFTLLLGKARTEYMMADYLIRTLPSAVDRHVSPYVTVQVCENVQGANGVPTRVCRTERVENPRYREMEMQKRLYEDRIDDTLREVRSSVERMQAILDTNPQLQTTDGVPAQQTLDEASGVYTELQQAFRRSTLFW